MAVTKQKKEEILQDLVDKFSRSHSVVFANYRGLDVASISELRSELRKEDAEMRVAKKTLIGLAAKDSVGSLDKAELEGPVVATFSYEDPLSGIRILFKFSKKNEYIKLLGGIIDGKVVGPGIIRQFAILPSRNELLAKFIGSMNSPLSGFVGIGNSLIGKIVRVLNAYKDTMPAESALAPDPVEEKVEEKTEEATVEEEKKEDEEKPAEETTPETPADEPKEDTQQNSEEGTGEATENDTEEKPA